MIWYWVCQYPVNQIEKWTTRSHSTIIVWDSLCGDVSASIFDTLKNMGGPCYIVQIGERLFKDERTHNRGRLLGVDANSVSYTDI